MCEWFFHHYPTLIFLLVGAFIAWKARGIYNRFTKVETEHNNVNTKLDLISTTLKSLVVFLSIKHKDMNVSLYTVKSPIQLSELGVKVLEEIKGKEYIDKNIDHLISLLEKANLKSALDVENYSQTVLMGEFNSDSFTIVKNYLFNNPIYKENDGGEINLDIQTVMSIMGIYLRDKYFEKHSELKTESLGGAETK